MELILGVFEKLHIDETFFIQFAVLVAFFFILKAVFFNKLQFVLELRESKTVKLEENANKKFIEAQNLSDKYKKEIDKIFQDSQEKMNRKKVDAVKSEKNMIAEKGKNLNLFVEQKRSQFKEEVELKSKEILGNADQLASSLIDKIIQ